MISACDINNCMIDILDRYDSIVVFGNYRYGSTVLCDLLHGFLESQGIDAQEWNEYLHSNKYLAPHIYHGVISQSLDVDMIDFGKDKVLFVSDPPQPHIVRAKLEHWRKARRNNFIVFKISPDDFGNGNSELIREYVLDDPRVYKLGLNRSSVGNAAVSYAIGTYHNVWNDNDAALKAMWAKDVPQARVQTHLLQHYVNLVLRHNHWLYFNADILDEVAWFEDLSNLNLPGIGYHGFTETDIEKHPIDHATRARKYFTNADDLLSFSANLDAALRPLIDNLRSTKKASAET